MSTDLRHLVHDELRDAIADPLVGDFLKEALDRILPATDEGVELLLAGLEVGSLDELRALVQRGRSGRELDQEAARFFRSEAGSEPRSGARAIAEGLRLLVRPLGTVDELSADDNAGGDFKASCDAYEALAFSLHVPSGREFYITVEDVTLPEDER